MEKVWDPVSGDSGLLLYERGMMLLHFNILLTEKFRSLHSVDIREQSVTFEGQLNKVVSAVADDWAMLYVC